MPVGIGLSGAGFLIFFLLGCLSSLEEGGVIRRGPGVPAEALTPLAGSSAGSILSIVSCLGVSYDVVYREATRLADYCEAHNDCALSLDVELKRTLRAALEGVSKDPRLGGSDAVAAAVERCRGKAFVNLSVFAPEKTSDKAADEEDDNNKNNRKKKNNSGHSRNSTRRSNDNALSEIGLQYRPGAVLCAAMALSAKAQLALLGATQGLIPRGFGLHPEPWLVSDWRSADDAIDAVAASSFNLLLSGLSPTTSFRGRPLVADGIYTVPLPAPPLEVAARSIRIASVPEGYAMAPGSPPIRGADIWPGARTGDGLLAGLTVEEWLCHGLVVADRETRRAMYELGRREAQLYLQERREGGELGGGGGGGGVGAVVTASSSGGVQGG